MLDEGQPVPFFALLQIQKEKLVSVIPFEELELLRQLFLLFVTRDG